MSTTVSNPYSFNIKNNTGFAVSSIAASLPSNPTALVWHEYDDNYGYYTIIPPGVKVIKGYISPNKIIYIGVTPGKKYICNCIETNTFDNEGREDYGKSIYSINSKVTWYRTDAANFGDSYDYPFMPTNEILYSASINNQTPTVTDY